MPRPPYKPSDEHLQTVYKGAKKGLTEREIAKAVGIAYTTFQRHKEEFTDSLKKGREELEAKDPNLENVENALLKRALGFEYEERRVKKGYEYFKNKDGKSRNLNRKPIEIILEITTTIKQISPDVTAQIFYLVNRSEGRWRSVNAPENLLELNIETQDILEAQADLDGYQLPEK